MHELSLGGPATRAELPPLTRRRTYVSNLGELHARPSAPTAAGASAVAAAKVYRTEAQAAAKLLGLSADRLSSMSSAAEARALQMTCTFVNFDSGGLVPRCKMCGSDTLDSPVAGPSEYLSS